MKESDPISKTALFKLAFFEPNLEDENSFQIIDYLILDCISGYGSLLACDAKEIAKYIKNTYLITFDEAEISRGAERLEKKGCIKSIKPLDALEGTRYKFVKYDDKEQLRNYKEIQELEDLVMSEWADNLKVKYGKILDQNKTDKIVESVKAFLTKMFVRHGKETVSMLYPENNKTQEWITSIQDEIIKDLPKLDIELDLIIQIEIPDFFKSETPHRKQYLNNLFNASFLWHLLQVDENCTEYFKETTKNQLLILDANILFSLIGLHGEQVFASIHQLLKYANNLEYKLAVTTRTLDEFYESIKRSCEKAYEIPTFSKNLAQAAIKILDSHNFLVSYWKEFLKNGLTISEFAVDKSHINTILAGLNISVLNDFREEIEKSQDILDEESILRSTCGSLVSPSVVQHDAFHCILIKKLRQNPRYKYSDATAWFLTHDSKLPAYAHAGLKGSKALPFCITTNEWIQINRAFLKRTENEAEFEQSFQILVTQPYLRSLLNNFKIDKIKERLLLRLNRYNNMSTQLAFEMATDVHFLVALSNEKDEKAIDKKIDNIIVDINKDLEKENKELYLLIDQQSEKNEHRISALKESIDEIKDEIIDKNSKFDNLINEIERLRDELRAKNNENQESNLHNSYLRRKYENLKNLIKWTVFGCILVPLEIIIWALSDSINWEWYQNLENKTVFNIILGIIILLSALNIPISKHWKIWLPLTGGFLIALLTVSCL